MTDQHRYDAEVQERWGGTDAFRAYAQKTAAQRDTTEAALHSVMEAFAACRQAGKDAGGKQAQQLVKALQDCITEHCYPCTKPILAGLGEMYVRDERFRQNIDRHGDGTAAFIRDAIAIYCK